MVSAKAVHAPVSSLALKLDQLEEDPLNARQVFDKDALQRLADSLVAQGQLQPVLVRLMPGGKYRIVDGHRRARAAGLAGLTEIRCELVELDDPAAALAAATANLQREDLTPYEEARAYKSILELLKASGQKATVADVARLCNVAHNTVKHRLELLELPESIAQRVDRAGFTHSHAKLVLPFASDPKALAVAVDAMSDKDGKVPTVDVAGARMVEALQDKKLVVNVAEAAGLRHTYGDGHAKARLATLVKQTGAFSLSGAGRYGGDAQLALATPKVLEAVKTAAKKEKELKAKREASYGYTRSKPISPEERAKGEADEKLEADARTRSKTLRLKAVLAKTDKISSVHVAELLFENRHDDKTLPLLLDELGVKGAVKDLREAAIKAIGKLPVAKAVQYIIAHKVSQGYEYDREENQVVQDITGKKYSDFLSAAKVQIREEAKKAKAAAKPVDVVKTDKKPKAPPAPATKAAKPKVKGKAKPAAKKPVKETPAVAKARAKLAKAKQATLPKAAAVDVPTLQDAWVEALAAPLPPETPATEPEAQTS